MNENGEKNYCETEIYKLFFQNCLMLFGRGHRSLEKLLDVT